MVELKNLDLEKIPGSQYCCVELFGTKSFGGWVVISGENSKVCFNEWDFSEESFYKIHNDLDFGTINSPRNYSYGQGGVFYGFMKGDWVYFYEVDELKKDSPMILKVDKKSFIDSWNQLYELIERRKFLKRKELPLFIHLEDSHKYYSNNEIYYWPFEVQSFSNIKEIDLSGSPIGKIGKSLEKMCKIKCLKLRGCEIDSSEASFKCLPCLEVLDLSKNNLKFFPEGVINLSSLKSIDLSYNKISEIDVDIPQSLFLDLSGNPLNNDSMKRIKGFDNVIF